MKKKILLLLLLSVMIFTGCTKRFTVEGENKSTKSYVSNILCQPTTKAMKKIYEENADKVEVDVEKLVSCKNFKVTTGGYEGLWTSIFVKPLAWVIIQIGKIVWLLIQAMIVRQNQ